MRLVIDGVLYDVNLEKVSEHLQAFYLEQSKSMQVLDVGGGKKLDFSKKGVIRIGMKAAMVPFVIPVIGMLYRMRGLEPPKHAKHEDLIDWMVIQMLKFAAIIEGDVQLNASSKAAEDDNNGHHRVVESLSTFGSSVFRRRPGLPAVDGTAAIGPAAGERPEGS